jgi:hypothetical protein
VPHPRSPRARLSVESLEPRENPAGGPVETFDQAAPPTLPSGWVGWSNDGADVFQTAAGTGVGGSVGLVSSAGSRTAGLAWSPAAASADTGAAVSVKVDSLVPTFVFARGTNLGARGESYLAAVITRGVQVELWQVVKGVPRVVASVSSPGSQYFSGGWVRVSLVPTGGTAAVRVVRADTGQYLNPQGVWQAAPADAISAAVLPTVGPGRVGVGRLAQYWGPVHLDDFAVLSSGGEVREGFDTTPAGTTVAGWQGWSTDPVGAFRASAARALSPANGFTSTGTSATAARGWADTPLPADVEAATAVYLDSLIPAQLFVRGSGLDTPAPTYYAVTLTRGLEARLVRVVGGVETTLDTLTSANYFSGQWLRVRLAAEGDRLRVVLFRPDTQQWLTPDGAWSDSPDYAFDLRDGAISGVGRAGVGRVAKFAGAVTFDDFEARGAGSETGPTVTVSRVTGSEPVAGEVTFRATVTGPFTRVEFRLNNQLRATSATAPADWAFDSTTVANGTYTLTVRAFDAAGNVGLAEYRFEVRNPNAEPLPRPNIPRHYSHIRIAQLAYSGNPMGPFEQALLRQSVDLVIPNTRYLPTIQAVAPDTPQLIYSNVSNLYQGLLTDWLEYADRAGVSRELAFYHVTRATPWTGASPSSQPVTWFWGGYQVPAAGGAPVDVTSAIRGGRNFDVSFGAAGQWTAIGYPERFRELNVTLVSGASAGWTGVWEYAAAVDANGNPTSWKPLPLGQDGTAGLTRSGTITFDPPPGWAAASVGGSARLYYVRLRATAGSAAAAPVLKTVFGRDYVRANGTFSGVIPAFDYAADKDRDGYLNDAEYATRAAGMDARFVYESRLFYPYYGQMRFVTNPSASAVRKWAAEYHVRLLADNPLADGIFMDNAHGKLPFPGVPVLEPTATFGTDSGALIAAVSRAIAPRWVLSNTAGGTAEGDPIAAASAGVIEEFLLRPLQANWSEVGDAANLVARRLAADGAPYLVIDSFPAGGSPTDPRTQLATLAYYYLLADPDRTFLMFFGGSSPSTSWTEHWSAAAAVDVGRPTGPMRVFATGTDPLSPPLTYRVLARDYENALVLYKPLSYAQGLGEGTINPQTATTHQLGGNYRAVRADGTLGPVVSSITLRNGEGAVLIRA